MAGVRKVRLEDVLLENAASFLQTSEPYQLCIAIELMMKAAILHGGGTEARNRRDVRPSLPKAIDGASRAGLDVEQELSAFAVRFSPYYEVHRLAAAPSPTPAELERFTAAGRRQLRAVRRLIDGGRQTRLTPDDMSSGRHAPSDASLPNL